MAVNYYTGEQNFPSARFLDEMWTLFGAMQGDSRSMELKAILKTRERAIAGDAIIWMNAAARFGDESTLATAVVYGRTLKIDQPFTETQIQEAGAQLEQQIRDVMAESGQQQNTAVPDRDMETPQ